MHKVYLLASGKDTQVFNVQIMWYNLLSLLKQSITFDPNLILNKHVLSENSIVIINLNKMLLHYTLGALCVHGSVDGRFWKETIGQLMS